MHPPIKLSIFPILSSLGMISSVIESFPYNFQNRDRDCYGWSPTHMPSPPLMCPRMRTFRTCPRRMMILSGGPRIGPWSLLAFMMPPFLLLKQNGGPLAPAWLLTGRNDSASENRALQQSEHGGRQFRHGIHHDTASWQEHVDAGTCDSDAVYFKPCPSPLLNGLSRAL